MQLCKDHGSVGGVGGGGGDNRLLGAARREASAARDNLWLTLIVLTGWSTVVALVVTTLVGGR